jgi:hypothetical protein
MAEDQGIIFLLCVYEDGTISTYDPDINKWNETKSINSSFVQLEDVMLENLAGRLDDVRKKILEREKEVNHEQESPVGT